MSKKNTAPDNLTLDAIDAKLAGMSYGQYKAIHPNTAEDNEHRIIPTERNPTGKWGWEHYCEVCGKRFVTRSSSAKYCSDQCRHKNDYSKYGKKRKK